MSKLEGDHLDGFTFETIHATDGSSEVRIDGAPVEGRLSRFGEVGRQQAEAREDASTQADADEYERLQYEDPDFETVRNEMARLAAEVDEKDASRINSDYRTFVREYYALRNRMIGAEIDRPRTDEISRLREQLKIEDQATGCRQTSRRTALVSKIASFYGGR